MTNIQFVNHASYILHHDNISLITDPWIGGYAFHDGWSLIEL
jgi:L-ascorbate metabolism protein UlaG (beta-lactamase superfamily)